jgi:alpha-tubulin suppressor-like RCC1 family protein
VSEVSMTKAAVKPVRARIERSPVSAPVLATLFSAAYAWTALSAGCAEDATGAVVIVDADEDLRGAAESLRVQVLGSAGTPDWIDAETGAWRGADLRFPRRLTLAPRGGDATRRYAVVAEVTTASGVVRGRLEGGFVAGRVVEQRLLLEAACVGIACEPGQVCRGGRCEDVVADAGVDAAMADAEFGDAMAGDGGVPDAEGPPEDGGVDAGPGTDACAGRWCGGECVDTSRDVRHCGRCDERCPSGNLCRAGACVPVVRRVAAGGSHTCAVRSDGALYCWGGNAFGQLGDGTNDTRTSATRVTGLSGVVEVAAGARHTCAVGAGGSVACWGDNRSGQLGDGSTEARRAPTPVPGFSGAIAVAAGTSHSCAVTGTGSVWCWGDNAFGQLGDGTTTRRTTPVMVGGLSGVTALAAGADHTCALRGGGTVACWGAGASGQLGLGVGPGLENRTSPASVVGLADAEAIAAGHDHTCALRRSGAVVCFGANFFGQSSGSSGMTVAAPAEVADVGRATAVGAGTYHTCAVIDRRAVACWGENTFGQLGRGTMTMWERPGPVSLEAMVTALAGGGLEDASFRSSHLCALGAEGRVWCWGSNDSGQLGDRTTTPRSVPVEVVDL